ncbi:MAG: DUF5317 family protein [Clostridia bacterium]|nr:DUF5317 family protein [Clostridia bacterium]MDR3644005.1 DUF5317 family protein [Clostridia bacterium]
MLFEAAVAGLVFGLIAGGSIARLLDMPLKGLWLLIGSVLLSVLPKAAFAAALLSQLGTPGALCFTLIRYGLLLAFVAVNIRCLSVVVIGAGGFLNMLVTLANGGKMPVIASALSMAPHDAGNLLLSRGDVLCYTVAGAGTRLFFLCDRMAIPALDIGRIATDFASVGDLLIAAGTFLLVATLMKPRFFTRIAAKLKRA